MLLVGIGLYEQGFPLVRSSADAYYFLSSILHDTLSFIVTSLFQTKNDTFFT